MARRGLNLLAVAALLALSALSACRPGAVTARDEALGVAELAVDFTEAGTGDLTFAVDCPLDGQAEVTSLSWELWLGSRRFAVGLEGAPSVVRLDGGLARVSVRAPLKYPTLRWVPGASFVDVGLAGTLAVRKGAGDSTVRFSGRKEVIARGRPLLEDRPE